MRPGNYLLWRKPVVVPRRGQSEGAEDGRRANESPIRESRARDRPLLLMEYSKEEEGRCGGVERARDALQ